MNLLYVKMIHNMRSALYGNSSIDVCVHDVKWTKLVSVKLAGSSRIQCQTFVTRLVVMVMTAFVGTTKVVINYDLSFVLQDCGICKQWDIEKHISIEHNATGSHTECRMDHAVL
jgi:hypothetical protein